MGKPSMFSSNYKQQLKRRRVNTFLFILLLLSISFFGGKYYIDKHDISIFKNIENIKIVKNIKNVHIPDWWTNLRNKFTKKSTVKTTVKEQATEASAPIAKTKTKTSTKADREVINQNQIKEYIYTSVAGEKYSAEYEIKDGNFEFIGIKSSANNSDYSISADKSLLVFDIKSKDSIVICNSKGNFNIISRAYYTTRTTHKKLTKEATLSNYKGFVWAEKPYFTLDGRVVYVSRLPFVRSSKTTLYLWSVKLDGSNPVKLSEVGNNIGVISYNGYDSKRRLKVVVDGTVYYLDIGSYMLVK